MYAQLFGACMWQLPKLSSCFLTYLSSNFRHAALPVRGVLAVPFYYVGHHFAYAAFGGQRFKGLRRYELHVVRLERERVHRRHVRAAV